MKIGYIITGLGTGGAEKHLLKTLPLSKHDKFVISLTNQNSIGKKLEKKKVKVYYLNLSKFNFILPLLNLFIILYKENPNLINTYLIHANLIGRIAGKILRIPVINSVRNDYSYSRIYSFLDKLTSGFVKVYAPNSKSLSSYLRKIKVPKNKIIYLSNVIDTTEFNNLKDIRSNFNIRKSSKVFISVARFVKQKNHKIIIDAFREYSENHKNSFLFLLGDGKLLKEYKKKYTSKNIIFTGKVDNVKDFLYSSDTFILASSREGMSNALLEAMYLGLNCIVSNIKQNTELIDKNCGYSFKNKSDLVKLLSSENKFGKNAQKKIKRLYNLKDYYSNYEEVISKCVE